MQNPRQAQTRLKPLLTHSRRVNQTLGAGRRWAEVWVAGTAREELKQNASVWVLSTPDSTICRLPASIAEVGEDGLPLGICPRLGTRTGIKDSAGGWPEGPQTTATVTTLT